MELSESPPKNDSDNLAEQLDHITCVCVVRSSTTIWISWIPFELFLIALDSLLSLLSHYQKSHDKRRKHFWTLIYTILMKQMTEASALLGTLHVWMEKNKKVVSDPESRINTQIVQGDLTFMKVYVGTFW